MVLAHFRGCALGRLLAAISFSFSPPVLYVVALWPLVNNCSRELPCKEENASIMRPNEMLSHSFSCGTQVPLFVSWSDRDSFGGWRPNNRASGHMALASVDLSLSYTFTSLASVRSRQTVVWQVAAWPPYRDPGNPQIKWELKYLLEIKAQGIGCAMLLISGLLENWFCSSCWNVSSLGGLRPIFSWGGRPGSLVNFPPVRSHQKHLACPEKKVPRSV